MHRPGGRHVHSELTDWQILLALGHGTFIFFPDPIYNW
jgi:hypothetical protein